MNVPTGKRGELVRILLAEDSLDDIMIMQKALKGAAIINQLYVVRDGQEALDFLQHQGAYQDASVSPRPGLILLDINMPKVTGIEVLKHIKQDPELKRIPVVMLTVSKRDEDVLSSYDNGCNSFLQKPVEFDRFVELVKQIGLYWGLLNIDAPDGA
jgi:CheY-like chemotaxis protein